MTISANYPTISPSIDLDFANSQQLDPRISFTRAGTGTYYDGETSAIAEQNLLLQSNTFSNNLSWTNNSTGIVIPPTSSVSDPFGGTSAWTLTTTAGTNQHNIQNNQNTSGVAIVGIGAFSCYAQANTVSYVTLNSYNQFAVTFFLSGAGSVTQTIVVGSNTATGTITQIGSSTWYRVSVAFNTPVAGLAVSIGVCNTGTPSVPSLAQQSWTAAGGESINIYGAQLEQHTGAGVYVPTTTTQITNYIPQLLTAVANQPRFDFNPTTRQSLGLLMEQQSTNLLTYSSDYTQSVWTATNATVTASANISPDGTLDAQLLTDNSTNGLHNITQTKTLTATPYTFSIYAKAGSITYMKMSLATSGTNGVIFNLSTGAYVSNDAGFTYTTPQSVGNGWYRYSITFTGTAASYIAQVLLCSNSTTFSYIGSGQNAYFFGAQVEATAFPTSYIPTVASQVTRAQDFATMTGTNFSSWFNNQQGTVYCSFDVATLSAMNSCIWGIDNNVGGSTIGYAIQKGAADLTAYQNASPTVGLTSITAANATQQTAYSYNNISGSYRLAAVNNGGTVGATTTPTQLSYLPTQLSLAKYGSNTNPMTGHIRKFAYYPISTSSAQMQALTGS